MLEKMLSRWGRRVYIAILVPLCGWWLWETFADVGLAHHVNRFQASILGGIYYEEVTAILLGLLALAISFPIGLLYDYLAGAGIFSHDGKANIEPTGGDQGAGGVKNRPPNLQLPRDWPRK